MPEAMLQQCIKLDIFDEDIPRIVMTERSFARCEDEFPQDGYTFWQQPLNEVVAMRWLDVYSNIHARLAKSIYQDNAAVVEVKIEKSGGYQVRTDIGTHYVADVLIAADGAESSVRTQLLPGESLTYAGYVAWRGGMVLPSKPTHPAFWDSSVRHYMFPEGHLLAYRIPSVDFKVAGHSRISWSFYQRWPEKDLPQLFTDNQGIRHTRSLPKSLMTDEHIRHLHSLAKQVLPKALQDLVIGTKQLILHAISDYQLPNHALPSLFFLGNAAATLRPHSASGVLKALTEGIMLFEKVKVLGFSQEMMTQWCQEQLEFLDREARKSIIMGEAMVNNPPCWTGLDQGTADHWWEQLILGHSWYATS